MRRSTKLKLGLVTGASEYVRKKARTGHHNPNKGIRKKTLTQSGSISTGMGPANTGADPLNPRNAGGF